MDKKILSLILLSAIASPCLASAATVAGMVTSVANAVVMIVTWIVVIMWVVTGILFLTAMGDAAKLNSAKLALFASIGGTILVILANTAESFVRNSFGL